MYHLLLDYFAYVFVQDPLLFVKQHVKSFENSGTTLRTLYYPALTDVTPKENQVRCGEHSDYGGITLLFQERPGLEVCFSLCKERYQTPDGRNTQTLRMLFVMPYQNGVSLFQTKLFDHCRLYVFFYRQLVINWTKTPLICRIKSYW